MAAIKRTSVFSIKECYAYPLYSDVEGEKPVYGKGIKVPAIQTISETKSYTTENLPGDGTICDTQSEFESLESSCEYGQLDHVVKSLIEGGLNRLTAEESQYIFGGNDISGQFALKFRAVKLGAGNGKDYMKTWWKCSAGTTSGDTANKAFKTNSFDLSVSRLEGHVLHPDGNDFELEQIRDAGAFGPIDPNSPMPTLPTVTTKPTLVSTNPAEGGTLVAASPATITATFSGELDDAYVTDDYFQVVDKETGQIITTDGDVDKNGSTPAQVDITVDIVAGKDYALIINKNVASKTHLVALGENKLVNFSGVAE